MSDVSPMPPAELMDPTLLGLWAFADSRSEEENFLEIFPDGRLAQYYKQHPSLTRRVVMTLRAAPEGPTDLYRVKTTAAAEGYLLKLRREGENLITELKRPASQELHSTRCRPIPDAEYPTWLDQVRASAVWR